MDLKLICSQLLADNIGAWFASDFITVLTSAREYYITSILWRANLLYYVYCQLLR